MLVPRPGRTLFFAGSQRGISWKMRTSASSKAALPEVFTSSTREVRPRGLHAELHHRTYQPADARCDVLQHLGLQVLHQGLLAAHEPGVAAIRACRNAVSKWTHQVDLIGEQARWGPGRVRAPSYLSAASAGRRSSPALGPRWPVRGERSGWIPTDRNAMPRTSAKEREVQGAGHVRGGVLMDPKVGRSSAPEACYVV
jgi:hypothetical protein